MKRFIVSRVHVVQEHYYVEAVDKLDARNRLELHLEDPDDTRLKIGGFTLDQLQATQQPPSLSIAELP